MNSSHRGCRHPFRHIEDCCRPRTPVFAASGSLCRRNFLRGGHGPAAEASFPCDGRPLFGALWLPNPWTCPDFVLLDRCALLDCGRTCACGMVGRAVFRRTSCEPCKSSATRARGRLQVAYHFVGETAQRVRNSAGSNTYPQRTGTHVSGRDWASAVRLRRERHTFVSHPRRKLYGVDAPAKEPARVCMAAKSRGEGAPLRGFGPGGAPRVRSPAPRG